MSLPITKETIPEIGVAGLKRDFHGEKDAVGGIKLPATDRDQFI